jgi:hypothetical protein
VATVAAEEALNCGALSGGGDFRGQEAGVGCDVATDTVGNGCEAKVWVHEESRAKGVVFRQFVEENEHFELIE